MAIERFEVQLVETKQIARNVKHLVFKKADGGKKTKLQCGEYS